VYPGHFQEKIVAPTGLFNPTLAYRPF